MTHIKLLSTLVSLIVVTTGCTRFKSSSPQGNSKISESTVKDVFGSGKDKGDSSGTPTTSDTDKSQNGSTSDNSGQTQPPADDSVSGGTSAPPPQDAAPAAGGAAAPAGAAGTGGTTPAAPPSGIGGAAGAAAPAAPSPGANGAAGGAGQSSGQNNQPTTPPATKPSPVAPAVDPNKQQSTNAQNPASGTSAPFNPFGSPAGAPDAGKDTNTTGTFGQNTASGAAAQTKPGATTPTAGANKPTGTPTGTTPAATTGGVKPAGTPTGTQAPAQGGGNQAAAQTKPGATTPAAGAKPTGTPTGTTPAATTGGVKPAGTPTGTQAPAQGGGNQTGANTKPGAAATDKPANPYVSNNIPSATTPGVVVSNPDAAQVNSGANNTTTDPKTTSQNTTAGTQPLGVGAAAGTNTTKVQKAPTAPPASGAQPTVATAGVIAVTKWKLSDETKKLYDFLTSVSSKKSAIKSNNPEITQWKVCSADTPTLFDSNVQSSTFKNAIGIDSGLPYYLRVKQMKLSDYGLSTEIMNSRDRAIEPIRQIDLLNYGFALGYDVFNQTESIINSIELQNSTALTTAISCAKKPNQLACKNWSAQRSQLQALNQSLRVMDSLEYVQRPSSLKCDDVESDLYYELVVNKKTSDQAVDFYKQRLESKSECFSRSKLSGIKILWAFKSPLAKPDLDAREKTLAIKTYVSLFAKMISRLPTKQKTINGQALSKIRRDIKEQVIRIKKYLSLIAPFLKYTKLQSFNLNDKNGQPIPVVELSTALEKVYVELSKARQQRLEGDTLKRLDYKSALVAVLSAAPSAQQGDSCRAVEFLLKDAERYVNRFVEDTRYKSWAQELAQEKSGFLIPFNLQAVSAMNGYKSTGPMVINHPEISKSLLQCFAMVQGKENISGEACMKLPAAQTTGEAVLAKILASVK